MRTQTESAVIADHGPLVRRRPEQIVAEAGYDPAEWTLQDYCRSLWTHDELLEICGLGPWAGLPFSTDPIAGTGAAKRSGSPEEPWQAGFLGHRAPPPHPGASAPSYLTT